MATAASVDGDILTDLMTSCLVCLLATGAILDRSQMITSDRTAAATSRLLYRDQSAEERGPLPQSKLKIGYGKKKIKINILRKQKELIIDLVKIDEKAGDFLRPEFLIFH